MKDFIENNTNPYQINISEYLGNVHRLIDSSDRRIFRAAAINIQIMPAIRLNQIHFVFNTRGAPVAYASWAYVSDEVSAQMLDDPDRLLHLSEWNEGDNIWLMDILSPHGYTKELIHSLKENRFEKGKKIFAFRRASDGTVKRLVQATI